VFVDDEVAARKIISMPKGFADGVFEGAPRATDSLADDVFAGAAGATELTARPLSYISDYSGLLAGSEHATDSLADEVFAGASRATKLTARPLSYTFDSSGADKPTEPEVCRAASANHLSHISTSDGIVDFGSHDMAVGADPKYSVEGHSCSTSSHSAECPTPPVLMASSDSQESDDGDFSEDASDMGHAFI
jgi:hypothetical protein